MNPTESGYLILGSIVLVVYSFVRAIAARQDHNYWKRVRAIIYLTNQMEWGYSN